MAGEGPEFALRGALLGHDEDARGLALVAEGTLASTSRDKTVRLWELAGGACAAVLAGHRGFVGPVAGVNATTLATGSQDASVIVWDAAAGTAAATLQGHRLQVTALCATAAGELVSGSLDASLRRWRVGAAGTWEAAGTVESAHSTSVLSLIALPDGAVLSGSGDCTIKRWVLTPDGTGLSCEQTFQGHTDSVRGLALLPGVGFLSASHDTTARLWTLTGATLAEFVGHTALVYCVAPTDAGLVVTGSEDNTAKVWRADGTCMQTMEHPGCVWAVAGLGPGGDFATACADGVVRLWTADPARVEASGDAAAALAASLEAKREASAGGAGGGTPSDVPMEDPSVLQYPGTRDGQTKVIRENGVGMAYSWNQAQGEWEKLGEVVAGPEAGSVGVGGRMLDGVEYDYVFDVELESGVMRKLPYNRGDNPYEVADRWLEQQNLPAVYREQVVDFILQNTQGAAAFSNPMPANVDPYTGGGAYNPSGGLGGGGGGGFAGGNADPYTGGGAYNPGGGFGGGAGGAMPMNVDPYTGVGAYNPGAAPAGAPAAARKLQFVPMRTAALIDTPPKWDSLATKLAEFSATLAADPATASLALTEAEGAALQALTGALKAGTAPPEPALSLLCDKLLRWPEARLFPALDVARMAALNPAGAARLAQGSAALEAARRGLCDAGSVPNCTLALRVLVNCFAHAPLKATVQAARADVLELAAGLSSSQNKNVRVALSTLVLDFAAFAPASDEEALMQLLSLVAELLLGASQEDPEALFRVLVAAGTLAHASPAVKAAASGLGVADVAKQHASSAVAKVAAAAQDLIQVLA